MGWECSCSWRASQQAGTGMLDVDAAQRYRPRRWLLHSRRADVISSLWSGPHINTTADKQTVRKEARIPCQGRPNEAAWTAEAVTSPEPTLEARRPHGSKMTGAVFCLQPLKHFRHPHHAAPVFSPSANPTPYPAAFTPPWKEWLPFTQIIKQPSGQNRLQGCTFSLLLWLSFFFMRSRWR